jgi:hypothetical protein
MMPAGTVRQRLAAAWQSAANIGAAWPDRARAVAIGWATVEADRAVIELADALDLRGHVHAFGVAPRSVALGGSCRVAPGVLVEGGSLVVLEPDTEGRLAAALARFGEGPVIVWLEPDRTAPNATGPGSVVVGEELTVAGAPDGPFGPERLVGGGTPPGLLLLLLQRPARTIRP